MEAGRVRDLVEVRAIRTVVHLADARDAGRRAELADGFVPTPQSAAVVGSVLGRMARREGGGLFVQGSYGSGKSHLLAYLGLAAEDAGARAAIAGESRLARVVARVRPGSWLVASLALVDHPARAPLEQLVSGAIGEALAARGVALAPPGQDRAPWRAALAEALGKGALSGVLLLVDELSESLRAKPDGRSFAEDVRYLQWLGEAAAALPAVVVAGLQEALDETGPIAPAAFDKIKDRYPERHFLTADHVGELVARRVLVPRAGARARVDAVHRRLRACLPAFDADPDRFHRLYPVHPATLAFLAELKPLFSQHRGVMDFLVRRLAGDEATGVPALLDAPEGTLLTPDAIWDHFEVRVRERVESAPLSDEVLGWWRANLASVVPREEERALALAALKVLALASLFAYDRPVSAREMATLLAVRATELDPALNELLVAELLERLAAQGPYLTREPADPLTAGYRIRRSEDAPLVVRARAREIALSLAGRDAEIARAVTGAVDVPHLPLASLFARGRTRRAVSWQNTLREGWVIAGPPEGLSDAERDALARELATGEADWVLLLEPPQLGPDERDADAGLPAAFAGLPVALLRPARLGDEEFVTGARARQLLARQLEAGSVPRGEALARALAPQLEDDRRRLAELAGAAYRDGRLVTAAGAVPVRAPAGMVVFESVLEEAGSALLAASFPEHFGVAPPSPAYGRNALAELVEHFFRAGALTRGKDGAIARELLEAFGRRLGLARRVGGAWQLALDPAGGTPAHRLLDLVGVGPAPLEELYWRLRKGPLGLTRPVFETLVLGLAWAGHLAVLAQDRRVPARALSAQAMDRATRVVREQPLDPDLATALAALPVVTPRARAVMGPAQARALADELAALRTGALPATAAMLARLEHARRDEAFAHLGVAEAVRALDDLARVLHAWTPRDEPAASLAALHAALAAGALFDRLAPVSPLVEFLERDADHHAAIAAWLAQDELTALPDLALAGRVAALRESARRPDVCLDAAVARTFRAEVAAFQRDYQAAYARDHELRRGAEAVAAHERLAASPQLAFVEALASSPLAEPPAVLRGLHAALERARAVACTRFTPAALRSRATCACGHRLGEDPALPPAATLVTWLDRAASELRVRLSREPARAELERAAARLRSAGASPEAEALTALAAAVTHPWRPDTIPALMGAGLPTALRRAGELHEAPRRDISKLRKELEGKLVTATRVRRTVDDWLGPDLPADTLLQIVRGADADPLPPGEPSGPGNPDRPSLAAWAADHGLPEQLASTLDAARVDESAGSLARFAARDGSPATLVEALFRERRFPSVARRLAERALSALSVAAPEMVRAWTRPATSPGRATPVAASERYGTPPVGVAAGVLLPRRVVERALDLERLRLGLLEMPGEPSRAVPVAERVAWWEARFAALVPLPLAVARLEAAAEEIGLENELAGSGAPARARAVLAAAGVAFARDYRVVVEGRRAAAGGPLWPPDVGGWARRIAGDIEARRTRVVMVDAMRFDVFGEIEECVGSAELERVAHGVVWALAPTVTAVNVAALEAGGAVLERLGELDRELHASAQPLGRLVDGVAPAIAGRLAAIAAELAADTLLVVTADHGFVEDPAWRPHGTARRYRHGGLDPFEVLVPVAAYRRRAT